MTSLFSVLARAILMVVRRPIWTLLTPWEEMYKCCQVGAGLLSQYTPTILASGWCTAISHGISAWASESSLLKENLNCTRQKWMRALIECRNSVWNLISGTTARNLKDLMGGWEGDLANHLVSLHVQVPLFSKAGILRSKRTSTLGRDGRLIFTSLIVLFVILFPWPSINL